LSALKIHHKQEQRQMVPHVMTDGAPYHILAVGSKCNLWYIF